MKALSPDSFLARLLGRLTGAILRRPHWFFWPQVALFLGCVAYTVFFLKADMNRDNLVGPNQKYHQNYLAFQKEFPQPDDLVVVNGLQRAVPGQEVEPATVPVQDVPQ